MVIFCKILICYGKYNYNAFLLADENNVSIKVVKYLGTDKMELVKNQEYGYRCLITATQRILDRLDAENTTYAKIEYFGRKEQEMIDSAALKEAVINAIVHNDYSYGNSPIIELYSDRIEITSAGGLPQQLSKEDFFGGVTAPRNKELIRVFKDVDLIENIGSGILRILKVYDKDSFIFLDNFLRVSFKYRENPFEYDQEISQESYQKQLNETQNKKILTLENPVEYRHHSKKSLIVQKEVGRGRDSLTFSDGVKNSLREDCDILVIGEIRDKVTMEAAIEMAESGHLVIGTLHTKSCAETIDRMINFYEVRDQASIKYLLSSLLKLVVSQRLLPGIDGKLVLIPEVMVVDNIVSGIIRKDKISVSEIEDAIQSSDKGSIGLINSIATLFVDDKITLEQAKSQIEEKNIEILNRTIMQMKIRRDTRRQ